MHCTSSRTSFDAWQRRNELKKININNRPYTNYNMNISWNMKNNFNPLGCFSQFFISFYAYVVVRVCIEIFRSSFPFLSLLFASVVIKFFLLLLFFFLHIVIIIRLVACVCTPYITRASTTTTTTRVVTTANLCQSPLTWIIIIIWGLDVRRRQWRINNNNRVGMCQRHATDPIRSTDRSLPRKLLTKP